MGRYVLRRLLQLIPVFFGTTFLIYILVWAVPGDPFAGKCGERRCPDAYIAFMTEKYHLDQNVFVQYFHYMQQRDARVTSARRSAAGRSRTSSPTPTPTRSSWRSSRSSSRASSASPPACSPACGATASSTTWCWSPRSSCSRCRSSSPASCCSGCSACSGASSTRPSPPAPPWSELIVPGFVLASASMAFVARLTRTSIAENRRADYVRTAIAKGLPMRRVVGVHLLRNSLIPVLTFLGTDLGALMGGAIVTEGIFNINGIGRQVYRAIITKEGATVVGIVVVLVIVYLLDRTCSSTCSTPPSTRGSAMSDPTPPPARWSPRPRRAARPSSANSRRPTPACPAAAAREAPRSARRRLARPAPQAAVLDLGVHHRAVPRDGGLPVAVHVRSTPPTATLSRSRVPPSADAWFGYDVQGRDVYARVIYGARASIVVGRAGHAGHRARRRRRGRDRRLPGRLARRAAVPDRRRLLRPAVRARRDRHPEHVQRSRHQPQQGRHHGAGHRLPGGPRLAGRDADHAIRRCSSTKDADYIMAARALGAGTPPDHLQAPASRTALAPCWSTRRSWSAPSSAPRRRCRSSAWACEPGGVLGHHDQRGAELHPGLALPAVLPRRVPRARRAQRSSCSARRSARPSTRNSARRPPLSEHSRIRAAAAGTPAVRPPSRPAARGRRPPGRVPHPRRRGQGDQRRHLPRRRRRDARRAGRVRLREERHRAGDHGHPRHPARLRHRRPGPLPRARTCSRMSDRGPAPDPRRGHRDGVPGRAVRAEPGLHRRVPDRRAVPDPPRDGPRRTPKKRAGRDARPGQDPERQGTRQGLPAPVLRWHAAARR